MSIETTIGELKQGLFSDDELNVYAIIDGASAPALQDRIYDDEPQYRCLFTGNLAPDLLEVAPFVVKLDEGTEFADWVISEGWGKHWGIFAVTAMTIQEMRKHLRTFLTVESPEGKSLMFRFYDPRVFRVFLPTCDDDQLSAIFGDIESFLLEDEDPSKVINFRLGEEGLESNLEHQRETA
jgi:hypothetical protein